MGRHDWLDVDLDFFNGADDPVEELATLLNTVNPSTPAAIVVEHHRVVAHVRRAIRSGYLRTPFTVLHVDEHHDFYHGSYCKTMHCGNFGYFLEKKWYDRFTWVANDHAIMDDDWSTAQAWLRKHKKKVEVTRTYPWKKRSWSPSRIKYATFAVSPDYLEGDTLDCAEDMVKLVAKRFGLTTTIVPTSQTHTEWPGAVEQWGTARDRGGVIDLSLRDNIATGRLPCRPCRPRK